MVLVLVDAITNRLKYTFDFIFATRGITYELVTSQFDFEERDVSYRLNYSSRSTDISKKIEPTTLLRETHIRTLEIVNDEFEGEDCFRIDGLIDPIASVFLVLTRYEEYGVIERDEHSRYIASNAALVRYGWNNKAMADRWSRKIIEFVYPELYLEAELRASLMNAVRIVPTFDIDNAFAYKHKTLTRTFLSSLKDLFTGNRERLKERSAVKQGKKDPYDTYDLISEICSNYEGSRIFWLTRSNGEKDRNVPISNQEHRALIRKMNGITRVGIHPSYGSFGNLELIEGEIKDLEQIIEHQVTDSRFHFLRFNLPESYNNLVAARITNDHSMGFAEITGFRAGTARSFNWFDLQKNEVTPLAVHPFIYMDGTLNEYLNLPLDESKLLITGLYQEVRKYGGDFRFIWHNETINNEGKWAGWKSVLDHTLNLQNG